MAGGNGIHKQTLTVKGDKGKLVNHTTGSVSVWDMSTGQYITYLPEVKKGIDYTGNLEAMLVLVPRDTKLYGKYDQPITLNTIAVTDATEEIGGFRVTIKSYLYKLKWNEETAAGFYNDFYFDDSVPDVEKKKAYEMHPELYRLEFVGVSSSSASETSFVGVKNASEALRRICVRVIDKNIADLQKSFPEFRIKAPLMSVDPPVLISD